MKAFEPISESSAYTGSGSPDDPGKNVTCGHPYQPPKTSLCIPGWVRG
jgi:hypothetical protein